MVMVATGESREARAPAGEAGRLFGQCLGYIRVMVRVEAREASALRGENGCLCCQYWCTVRLR